MSCAFALCLSLLCLTLLTCLRVPLSGVSERGRAAAADERRGAALGLPGAVMNSNAFLTVETCQRLIRTVRTVVNVRLSSQALRLSEPQHCHKSQADREFCSLRSKEGFRY